MRTSTAILLLLLLIPFEGAAQDTLWVLCDQQANPVQVKGKVSYSNDKNWRAYVDVRAGGDRGYAHTTVLWVGFAGGAYRPAYIIPPEPLAYGNGMKILGWAKNEPVLLARTSRWQEGSDALDDEGVLAVNVRDGSVYQPDLSTMMDRHRADRCYMRILDASIVPSTGVNIIVRVEFKTYIDVDERPEDITPAPNCNDTKETWSFDFNTGRTWQLSERQPVPSGLRR